MYKVIVKCKENKDFYTENEYFNTRKEARNYIKTEKEYDKKVFIPNGVHYTYKIVKI